MNLLHSIPLGLGAVVSTGLVLTVLFVISVFLVTLWQVVTNLIYICSPNEVLVFSGAIHRDHEGRRRGYRVVKGGRAMRVPFFETVDRMDLTNMNIEVEVKGAFSKHGIPLNINGIANVKIAGESPALDNALQRILGKPRPQIMRIAKETLEGYLRGVMATLTPEEVNENTQAFERELRKQAGEGLEKLGITLDNLKIQAINDEVGYLDAVGRVRGAQLNRDNRTAEAQRKAESLMSQADSRQRGELAKIGAQMNITRAESQRRIANAKTAQLAYVAEQEGEVAALITRARAELGLQDARLEQQKHQLEAEVVTPARAQMEASIAEARGQAAPILERGRAQATALTELARQWEQAGAAAQDIFVLQKLEAILPTFLESIRHVHVHELTMLQAGNGEGTLATQALSTVKALEAGGVDLSGLLHRLGGGAPGAHRAPKEAKERHEAGPAPAGGRLVVPPPPPPLPAAPRGFTPSTSEPPRSARLVRRPPPQG